MGIPIGFLILAAQVYLYFIVQYFFTQLFYSKYNISFLFLLSVGIPIAMLYFSPRQEWFVSLLYTTGLFYYSLLLLAIKVFYKKFNSFLIKHHKIKDEFTGKGFTYVTYHKGIYYRGHSWDEDLATKPSWLDHALSWTLTLLPIIIVFSTVAVYGSSD